MIQFDPKTKLFRLDGKKSSYILGISSDGDLHHLHWGAPINTSDLSLLLKEWSLKAPVESKPIFRELYFREFPDFGHNDLRCPAFQVEQADGSRLSRFAYVSHEITKGKPEWKELPQANAENSPEIQTLKVTLADQLKNQQLDLYYTIYSEQDILTRRSVLKNNGSEAVNILKFMSVSLDFASAEYHLTSFGGAWARERGVQERKLIQGTTRLESRRGQSSHEINPFVIVSRGQADEEKGEAYGFALVYSGNWVMEAEIYRNHGLRVNMGLNDFDFKWRLEKGESFVSPECVMAYSENGFSNLSLQYHRFIRKHILRGPWKDKVRPILINNWEATYFNFKHDDIVRIAKGAKEIGIDMLVLDDGWFGERNNDDFSLGDWFEDKTKLPRGMKGLSEDIHSLGMKFGLWFEPEMISPKSRIYEKHPDWCLHVQGRDRNTSRNQLVFDLSRAEVRDYLYDIIGNVLEDGKIDYVKWDMNRPHTEVGNEILPPQRQAEIAHRQMLGVYELMGRLNQKFPQVLFEGCAGGGGRFDMGLLNYHPQIWTSDNTDGLDRIFIQYGTSFCYPPLTHSSHVSASPCHQTGRATPLKWRHLVAMSGNLGYEVDVSKWSAEEKKEAASYIQVYKKIAPLVQFGDYYRLESPYESDRVSWIFVNEAKTEAVLFVFQIRPIRPGLEASPIRLRGLDLQKKYQLQTENLVLSGEGLLKGEWLPESFHAKLGGGDYQCELYHFIEDSSKR